MKRKKFLSFIFCVNNVLFYCCGGVGGSPAQNLHNNIAVNKFQSALQQQSFFSILTSIEERLRNLDNIYSMQLSQTLETKLDQYNRRLEALDSKIIRLEALVMLNLDKISENISTKNFKDDVTKTNTLRKIDTVYEGISHRLNYMDRKYETNFVKIQTKLDTTLTRLEKIEESMATRDSDIEAELSDAIFAIDDLKTTYNAMEGKLLNITSSTFNISRDNYKLLSNVNMDYKKSLNMFHDNIIENLQYMDNKTGAHYKTTQENNIMLKSMKTELKDDFNDYANKVADMNSYIWKNSDTTEDDLKMIATVVNSTKVELQNGVRSLMVQIGKLSNKENIIPEGNNNLEDINKKLTTNFEKILTNQDLFIESCYRLQMDESQIESEISAMFEKLIGMLEKKMASEMKGIKNLEKVIKSHDSKVNRNVYQVNSNVISLFEKSTIHNDGLKNHMTKIINDLDALFAFVQSTTPAGASPSSTINVKAIMDKLNKIENYVHDNYPEHQISDQMDNNSKILHAIEFQINKSISKENIDRIFSRILPKYLNCSNFNDTKIESTNETEIDTDTRKIITDIFGPNPDLKKMEMKSPDDPKIKSSDEIDDDTRKAIADIFGPNTTFMKMEIKVPDGKKIPSTDEIDDDTRKIITDIFGPNTNLLKVEVKSPDDTGIKRKCKNPIDIRYDTDQECEENKSNNLDTNRGTVRKKKRRPYRIDVRSNLDSNEDVEYEESEETTENTTELEILTDETVVIDISTESTTTINEDVVYSLAEIKPNDTINKI